MINSTCFTPTENQNLVSRVQIKAKRLDEQGGRAAESCFLVMQE